MKYLSALGVLVGGFLLHPPPKAVLTTKAVTQVLWLGGTERRGYEPPRCCKDGSPKWHSDEMTLVGSKAKK